MKYHGSKKWNIQSAAMLAHRLETMFVSFAGGFLSQPCRMRVRARSTHGRSSRILRTSTTDGTIRQSMEPGGVYHL